MEEIITKDGSVTLKNKEYDENYHSISGALEEAFGKFAKPCNLKNGMKIFDICFGLGYNSLAAISMANVKIVALENDPTILKQIKNIRMPINYQFNNNKTKNIGIKCRKFSTSLRMVAGSQLLGEMQNFRAVKCGERSEPLTIHTRTTQCFSMHQNIPPISNGWFLTNYNKNSPTFERLKNNYEKIKIAAEKLSYEDEKVKIKIIIDDARNSIKKLNDKFDAVFLDPFSPKKFPELWTVEFFADIRKLMNTDSVLATYSCAKAVRKNLENAGFEAKDGPSIGRKAPSTIAYAR